MRRRWQRRILCCLMWRKLQGQVTSAADEVSFIQRLEKSSFDRMDFVFFAGEAAETKKHWLDARRAGASIIDLTYALDGEKDVLVRAPWVAEVLAEKTPRSFPDLNTPAVVAAHPVAVMLALVAARLQSKLALTNIAATVMEPASEYGRVAMDELHQQTVNLLSFQTLPREQYDAQVSFNLLPELGEGAKVKLGATEQRIRASLCRVVERTTGDARFADGAGARVSWVCALCVGGAWQGCHRGYGGSGVGR